MLKKLALLSTLICSGLFASKPIEHPIVLINYTDKKIVANLVENHPDLILDQHTLNFDPYSNLALAKTVNLTLKKNLLCAHHPLWSRLPHTFDVTCSCTINGKEQTAATRCKATATGIVIYIENNELKIYTE